MNEVIRMARRTVAATLCIIAVKVTPSGDVGTLAKFGELFDQMEASINGEIERDARKSGKIW
jgi:hypothetical protein